MRIAICPSLQHAAVHEPAQPFGKDGTAHAQAGLEVLVAADPRERLAQDHQCPAVAKQRQRSQDRAWFVCQIAVAHA
jgi:hypothetical protein